MNNHPDTNNTTYILDWPRGKDNCGVKKWISMLSTRRTGAFWGWEVMAEEGGLYCRAQVEAGNRGHTMRVGVVGSPQMLKE